MSRSDCVTHQSDNWGVKLIIHEKVSTAAAAKTRTYQTLSIMALDLSFGLGYSPILWSIYTVFTISLCYYIGVSNGHLYPYVPSVSHTGASSPERNIFSMLLEFSAFWAIGNIVIRYQQVNILIEKVVIDTENLLLVLHNKVSLAFGFVSVLGLVIIANWPSPNVSI